MLDFEPLDMSELGAEALRVNTPNTSKPASWMDNLVKFPEGDGFTLVRILPRRKDQKIYSVTRLHHLKSPDGKGGVKTKSLHCPRELVMTERGPQWQGECIICKYYHDLWQQSLKLNNEKDQKDLQAKARLFKPVEKYYYNVIVREVDKNGDIKSNSEPLIFHCGTKAHGRIMAGIVGDKVAGTKAYGDITHPVTGRDFRYVKKTVGGYPNYDSSNFAEPSPLGTPEEMERWLKNLHDLSVLRQVKDADTLKHELRVALGMVKDENVDDDLAEFRTPSAQIREELVTSAPVTAKAKTEVKKQEEELLADDEFLKELEQM